MRCSLVKKVRNKIIPWQSSQLKAKMMIQLGTALTVIQEFWSSQYGQPLEQQTVWTLIRMVHCWYTVIICRIIEALDQSRENCALQATSGWFGLLNVTSNLMRKINFVKILLSFIITYSLTFSLMQSTWENLVPKGNNYEMPE